MPSDDLYLGEAWERGYGRMVSRPCVLTGSCPGTFWRWVRSRPRGTGWSEANAFCFWRDYHRLEDTIAAPGGVATRSSATWVSWPAGSRLWASSPVSGTARSSTRTRLLPTSSGSRTTDAWTPRPRRPWTTFARISPSWGSGATSWSSSFTGPYSNRPPGRRLHADQPDRRRHQRPAVGADQADRDQHSGLPTAPKRELLCHRRRLRGHIRHN